MKIIGALSAAFLCSIAPAFSADVQIAVATTPSSLDPHYHTTPANYLVNSHMFEPLVKRDANSRPNVPVLAESWKVIDDVTWEFKLRPNVRFHDGSLFTADDVAFTFMRAPRVPNSPGSFSVYMKLVKDVKIVDPLTIRVITPGPSPELLADLAAILIVSKKHGEKASTADYNAGKTVIGTGPYVYQEWTQGSSVTLRRNDAYWGQKEPWGLVKFRVIASDAPRVAALLSGEVDMIADVPTQDVTRLRESGKVDIWSGPASRFVFVALNGSQEALSRGSIFSMDGKPLEKNPLGDVRVRRALELAIDLDVIRDRVNAGEAITSGQYLSPGAEGYVDGIGPWKADLEKAKALIAEAGWTGKFKLVMYTSSDRIANSVRMAQVIAAAWTRIGVPTSIETLPFQVFSAKRTELPVSLSSWGNSIGNANGVLAPALHSRDVEKGFGTANYFGYSNAKLDELVDRAIVTMDDKKREELFKDATRIALDDHVYIPLFVIVSSWATRKGLKYEPRLDAQTLAMSLRPAP
jgi:peptide/nickel transport system substrate-binding protein